MDQFLLNLVVRVPIAFNLFKSSVIRMYSVLLLSIYGQCLVRNKTRPTHRLSSCARTHAQCCATWGDICLIDWQTSSILQYRIIVSMLASLILLSEWNERLSNKLINSPHECITVWLTCWQTCVTNYIIIKYSDPLQIAGVTFLKVLPRSKQNRGWRDQGVMGNSELEGPRLLATLIKAICEPII
jgi:hypothetical protein